MDILMALVPTLMWGVLGLVGTLLGGSSYSKTLGTTFGALFFAITVYIFVQPMLNQTILIVGFISGVFWTIGQQFQFKSMEYIGVSLTVPISAGMQLISTTIISVLVFNEWKTAIQVVLGTAAIFILIIGIVLMSIRDKRTESKIPAQFKQGIAVLVISTIGYVVYVIILRWFNIDGWSAILPQSIGMVVGAVLLSINQKAYTKYAFRNVLTGIIFATGNLFMLLSIPRVGVSISYSFSQAGAIISTIGGIVLLGEKKTKKQMVAVVIGCIFIVTGGILIDLTKG
ncbi:GRP family sugar transporter [Bacillus sp. TL12]|uniref:GRP family sugar transporter n=1 Tax=Bacillus sp. TL12 TaxID=2894756 RepID=UPI001F51CB95|nr:GRP family sugar transporter [Bacillus sp. TL12]MCI0767802.1 GRP family sugar transporter [Bacillus sp. TL12]